MSYLKIRNKALNDTITLRFHGKLFLTLALAIVCAIIAHRGAAWEGLKMPLFVARDAEFVDVMKYLAYSAVPIGSDVYFNVQECDGGILYEIGELNTTHFCRKSKTYWNDNLSRVYEHIGQVRSSVSCKQLWNAI